MSLKRMREIFDYAVDIRGENICQELSKILGEVLPSLAGNYNFHIIEIPINENREFCVFEHTHRDGKSNKCTTLFNKSSFGDIRDRVEKTACGDDNYEELSAFLSEVPISVSCKDGISSFATFIINDSALKLVTESNKFHIDWQRVNFCELDQLNNFIKYLYKTKTDSKQYFSKFFPYRGRVLAFCISVNTLYYEEHRNLFDNSFINFQRLMKRYHNWG